WPARALQAENSFAGGTSAPPSDGSERARGVGRPRGWRAHRPAVVRVVPRPVRVSAGLASVLPGGDPATGEALAGQADRRRTRGAAAPDTGPGVSFGGRFHHVSRDEE